MDKEAFLAALSTVDGISGGRANAAWDALEAAEDVRWPPAADVPETPEAAGGVDVDAAREALTEALTHLDHARRPDPTDNPRAQIAHERFDALDELLATSSSDQ